MIGLLLVLLFLNEGDSYSYETRKFEVPLDHFNYGSNSSRFHIRYLYNESFCGNRMKCPIFLYTGNEGDIELFAENTGFLWQTALELRAVVVFAEHRFYGKSLPSFCDESLKSEMCTKFITIEQVLEDYASLVYFLLDGVSKPVIAFGGSYGGMLAAWMRMKFPHLITGALAASAPIWQFQDLTPCDIFAKITTTVFTSSLSSNCSTNIKNSWPYLKKLSASAEGRQQISTAFKLCNPLKEGDIEHLFEYLEDMYGSLAMANYPYNNTFLAPLPAYPVRQFCYYLRDLHDEMDLIEALQKGINLFSNFTGQSKCLNYSSAYQPNLGGDAWEIQTCNEIVMPMCSSSNDTMFRDKNWDFQSYSDHCFELYKTRPGLNDILLRYGGKNLRYIENIIFSNGLLDPWSGGGVIQYGHSDINVILIPEGAHHLDLRAENPADPQSVIEARKKERSIISGWIDYF